MADEIVFTYTNYKDFLKAKLSGSWGAVSRAAQAAGCQRSYLSRVINGPVHLTGDHAYKLSEFWKMSPDEAEYFCTLLEVERATTTEYRTHLTRKLKTLRQRHENVSAKLERSRARVEAGQKEVTYYSAWFWSAIHILTSIPECQTERAIAQRLMLPEDVVSSTLKGLEKFDLVRRQGNRWIFSSSEIHVPKDSALVGIHHGNWRQRAVLNSQVPSDGVHYTTVQSMSRPAFERIRQKLLAFIEESVEIGGPSKEEELVSVTCDLFYV